MKSLSKVALLALIVAVSFEACTKSNNTVAPKETITSKSGATNTLFKRDTITPLLNIIKPLLKRDTITPKIAVRDTITPKK